MTAQKKQPVKTLHVLLVGNYRPDKQRSMQRFCDLLQTGLAAEGMTVDVFYPPQFFGRFRSSHSGLGKWLGYVDKYLLASFSLWHRLKKSTRPDIVHICDHSNAHYAFFLRGCAHLITCHDLLAVRSALGEFKQNPLSWTGRQQQTLIMRGLSHAQCICAVSQASADDVLRLTDKPSKALEVIPNALDHSFLEEANTPQDTPNQHILDIPDLPADAPYVMHIGSASWYKNRSTVLKIFAATAAQDASIHLIIVGPAFDQNTLQEAGCEHLSKRIHICSQLSDEQLKTLYRQAKVLLFPSLIEGFGWPILEAQACGCPVLTLDRAPMNTLNASPQLNLSTDSTQLAQESARVCLEYIQLGGKRRIAEQAKLKEFASNFTNEASVKAYLEVYSNLIAEKDAS